MPYRHLKCHFWFLHGFLGHVAALEHMQVQGGGRTRSVSESAGNTVHGYSPPVQSMSCTHLFEKGGISINLYIGKIWRRLTRDTYQRCIGKQMCANYKSTISQLSIMNKQLIGNLSNHTIIIIRCLVYRKVLVLSMQNEIENSFYPFLIILSWGKGLNKLFDLSGISYKTLFSALFSEWLGQ